MKAATSKEGKEEVESIPSPSTSSGKVKSPNFFRIVKISNSLSKDRKNINSLSW